MQLPSSPPCCLLVLPPTDKNRPLLSCDPGVLRKESLPWDPASSLMLLGCSFFTTFDTATSMELASHVIRLPMAAYRAQFGPDFFVWLAANIKLWA